MFNNRNNRPTKPKSSFMKCFMWLFCGEGVGTSNFTTTSGVFFHNVENGFLVDHYYENQNVEKNEKNVESLSFVKFLKLFYLWRKHFVNDAC